MADKTTRYIGDTEPLKFELDDDGVYRTDLATATSIVFLAVNSNSPTDHFGGSCTVIDPPTVDGSNHWNCKYTLTGTDTAAPGSFNCYVTVHEAGGTVIATYAVTQLDILDKT